ncbi:hypothetical protein BDC45DRAFT_530500 [Circinella umbellata]|nr:hypothetical protein BDC45DRAFT_530500 [Circinella umbellata]
MSAKRSVEQSQNQELKPLTKKQLTNSDNEFLKEWISDNFKQSYNQVVSPRKAYNHYKRGCKLFNFSTCEERLFTKTFKQLIGVQEQRLLSGPEGPGKSFWNNVANRAVPRKRDSYFILHDYQDDYEYPCHLAVTEKKQKN